MALTHSSPSGMVPRSKTSSPKASATLLAPISKAAVPLASCLAHHSSTTSLPSSISGKQCIASQLRHVSHLHTPPCFQSLVDARGFRNLLAFSRSNTQGFARISKR
ncbi:hypothetical protein BU23DRAFT_161842 [Bimuria novae-zelandiae CBS 107.79]|uniref:Uncharacterized protein n=1 Tax=Bimuria novae-zelandiae CBS 107.79 TaxID=1447943 RepID=A0A6A5VBC6_9PLEO|nr:hypothetical protein BU23DRAFT_161842 [Bimuria novae-zelandiae CBS 107.79]